MSEELPSKPQDMTEITPIVETAPEIPHVDLIIAQEAIKNGTATEEQKALVTGFEAGAQAITETTAANVLNDNPLGLIERIIGTQEKAISEKQDELAVAEMWGDDTRKLIDDIKQQQHSLQGNIDMEHYLKSRDDMDESGKIHDAETGQFKSLEQANQKPEELGKRYEDMSIDELTDIWAEAEDSVDRTTSINVQDELQERLARESGMTEDHKISLIDLLHSKMMEKRTNKDVDSTNEPDNSAESGAKILETTTETKDDNGEQNADDANKESEEALDFTAARGTGTLEEIAIKGMEKAEQDRREAASVRGIRGLLRNIAQGIKNNTLFQPETWRKRSEESLLKALDTQEESGTGRMSLEQFQASLVEDGITPTSGSEAALLESVSHDLISETEGFALHGEGEQETPEMTTLREGIKQSVLDFVIAAGAEGLTPEQRDAIMAQHQEEIAQQTEAFMGSNPDFKKENINVYADSSRQLLERALATMRHDDGMDRLESQLDNMRIDVGQRQIGAHNNINTEHVERTMELARDRRVGSVIGKATFVVATWVSAGALASGFTTWAAQSGSTRGTQVAALAVGSLAGPVGAVIGLAATTAASAAFGRHLGRRRESDNANLAATEIAYAGSQGESERLARITPETVSFLDATDRLRQYLEPKPGIVAEDAGPEDWQIRSGLSNEELISLSRDVAAYQAKFDYEDEFNLSASVASQAERDRGLLPGLLRSQNDPNGRALNLFQATDRSTYIPERNATLMALRTVVEGVQSQYGDATVDIPTLNEEGTVESTDSVPIDRLITTQLVEQDVATEARVQEYQQRVQREIGRAGRRGAIIAGTMSLAIGVGSAGVSELITHGEARTIFDMFDTQPRIEQSLFVPLPGNTVKGSNVEIIAGQNVGKSGASIEGNQAIFTNFKGDKIAANLGADGQLSVEDIARLKTSGVEVDQVVNLGTRGTMSPEKALTLMGGKQHKVSGWLNNNTAGKYEGTELGAHISRQPDGTIILTQDTNPPIATGHGMKVDLREAGSDGKVFARIVEGNKAITIPGKLHDGVITSVIKPGDPAQAMFTSGNHPDVKTDNWGFSYGDHDSGSGVSISTVTGHSSKINIDMPGSTKIDVSYAAPEPIQSNYATPGATFVGVVPPGTRPILGEQKSQEDSETQPEPVEEEPALEPNQEPTPDQEPVVVEPDQETQPEPSPEEPIVEPSSEPTEPSQEPVVAETSEEPEPEPQSEPEPVISEPVVDEPVIEQDDTNPGVQFVSKPNEYPGLNNGMYYNVINGNTNEELPQPGMIVGRKNNGDYVVQIKSGELVTYPKSQMDKWASDGRLTAIKSQRI